MYAHKGCGQAWMQPLVHDFGNLDWHNSREIRVSSVSDPVSATFCEPVEKANSSHSFTAGLAHSVGLRKQPLRVYSMVKYAAIARGLHYCHVNQVLHRDIKGTSSSESMTYWTPLWTDLDYQEVISCSNARYV